MIKKRVENLKEEFRKRFGDKNQIRIFNAPGRINLIGEHTDYNGGLVLPAAIDKSILAIGRAREDRILNLKSMNFEKEISISLDEIKYRKEDGWTNYPKGVAWVLEREGLQLKGADVIFEGNIPVESGLSSSAAIEVVSMLTFLNLSNKNLPPEKIALLSRKAENEFVGVSCGIMDQFIITFGKKNHALLIDCKILDYKLVPFRNEGSVLIVGNTRVKRGLTNSEYNKRVEECTEGLEILKNNICRRDIECLGDITIEEFNQYKKKLHSPIEKRCEHVINENERVKQAVDCLGKGDLENLGNLLNDSHYSLRDLYEVSCKELDVMVEAALKIKGVLGARMTGAGFGGCMIALVDEKSKEEFVEKVGKEYERKIGIKCEFYICKVENGAQEI
ncbi:galactokinase [candidate division WOR-3 bacterium]|nr:galactokinase [candidate division WOR-3 bacterium]